MEHRIASSRKDAGNSSNFDRDVIIKNPGAGSYTGRATGWINLGFTNHYSTHKDYDFAISPKAAEELMMTLDVILSGGEEEEKI